MRLGILPLGRSTFDVAYAEENLSCMLQVLSSLGHELLGPDTLLYDESSTDSAMANLLTQSLDHLLILQVTFTDSLSVCHASEKFDCPLSIWSIPEPRLGERLRLNSFCGLNLASHALSLRSKKFSWLYASVDSSELKDDLCALLSGERECVPLHASKVKNTNSDIGERIVSSLRGSRIARIGDHPSGFDTCAYCPDHLKSLCDISVDELSLTDLFAQADGVSASQTEEVRRVAQSDVSGLENLDSASLSRSLSLKAGLDTIRSSGSYDAFAIRCWPETFTEYGGAVCSSVSMLCESKVPCACESDVYGAVTQLLLQRVSDSPVFLADLVDIDVADNTGVLWHCGQAPISMRTLSESALATIHTNRRQPLLYEFAMRSGKVTYLRLSQSYNELKMVLGLADILDRPKSFTGTSGVVRFGVSGSSLLSSIMNSGLEHHTAWVYGDHRESLLSVASALDLPVLEL